MKHAEMITKLDQMQLEVDKLHADSMQESSLVSSALNIAWYTLCHAITVIVEDRKQKTNE